MQFEKETGKRKDVRDRIASVLSKEEGYYTYSRRELGVTLACKDQVAHSLPSRIVDEALDDGTFQDPAETRQVRATRAETLI
jgi:hypothetical protein